MNFLLFLLLEKFKRYVVIEVINLNAREIKDKLTLEHIITILEDLGAEPRQSSNLNEEIFQQYRPQRSKRTHRTAYRQRTARRERPDPQHD